MTCTQMGGHYSPGGKDEKPKAEECEMCAFAKTSSLIAIQRKFKMNYAQAYTLKNCGICPECKARKS